MVKLVAEILVAVRVPTVEFVEFNVLIVPIPAYKFPVVVKPVTLVSP